MRYLIFILLLLPVFCNAQNSGLVIKTGATNQATIQKGATGADSVTLMGVMDTARAKAYLATGANSLRLIGRVVLNSSDSTLYLYNGLGWVRVGTGGTTTDTTGLNDRINYNLTRINALSDSVKANRDSINVHRTAIDGKEPSITPGTTDQYWQGDKTWQAKSGLPISTATQSALDGKISYSDTPYIATQTYLENNYFKNGGNVFGDEFILGNLTWSQTVAGDGNGNFTIKNGAGPGWVYRIIQNNQDTVYTINTLNRHLFGTTTDRGYGFQVNKSVWLRDSVTIGNIPKRATPPDTTVGIVNGLLVSYPTPDGSDTIGLQGVLNNGNTATTGIYLSDYHNPDIISGTSKYSSFLSRLSYTNPDSAAIPFLSNNKWTIEDTLPLPIYDVMSIPIFHIEDTGEVRYQGITSNLNVDSTSTGGWFKNAFMMATGGHFGYPGVRVGHYTGLAVHNPVVYDTCEYCYGIKIGGFNADNFNNGTMLYMGGISNHAEGKWGIYIAPTIASKNYFGSSRTMIGLPSDTEIDNTATLQTSTLTTSGLIKSTTDLSGSLTNLSYTQKIYVDAADSLKLNITDTASMLSPYLRAYGVTNDANGLITLPAAGGINGGIKINGSLYLQTKDTQTTGGGTVRIGLSSNYTATTGTRIMNQVFGRFAPTSGTAVFSGYSASMDINQTGGANGITSSFWATPTITAAADYRAFRASNSSGAAFYNEHSNAYNVFLGETRIGGATDLGNYNLQVNGVALVTGEIYAPGISKAATKDSIVGWQNGQFFAIPKPTGGGGGSTAWGDITGTLSDQTDLQSALDGKQDTLGFTAENVANKATDFSTVNNTLYPTVEAVDDYVASELSGYLPSATAASTYVSLSGSYSNPTWITALAWSKITSTPTTLSGYGITDAVANTTTVNGQALSSNVTVSTITGNAGTATALQTGRTIDNVTFDGTANIKLNRVWQGKLAGETDTLTTGVKLTFRMPYACTVTGVKAAVNTASSSGNITIDIHENGNTIMATNKITIEATETTSLDATQQPVLTDTSIAADALIEVEVDVAGTNAISGEVTIYYTLQ